MRKLALAISCLSLISVLLVANTGTTPPRNTGAPVDGSQTCASCHNTFGAANSDTRGSVTISAVDYNPGTPQILKIFVKHPEAIRWGFQLTARAQNNETLAAGTFVVGTGVQVICGDTNPAPCNGAPEFAEHTLAPRTAAGAGAEFDVTWNPPSTEVGRVDLFVSAVAGNDDGTPLNDRVYTATTTLSLSPGSACNISKKPTLRGASNAGSGAPAFAPNSLLSIYGSGFQLASFTRQPGAGDLVNNAFPTSLGCVAVEINGQRAPITFVREDQINVQVPTIAANGTATLVVIANAGKQNEIRSDIATLNTFQQYAPSFLTFNGTSIAALFANSASIVADPIVVAGGAFAKPGDIVSLFGTGFGTTQPTYPAGALAPGIANVVGTVTVSIGGVTLNPSDVLYVGLSPGSITGLYQLNVRIPASVSDGNAPVIATIGGISSQSTATIPIKR